MSGSRPQWRRWLREPLLQFGLIGLALFAIDQGLKGSSEADLGSPKRIVVSASQQTALREIFRTEHGREPNSSELQARLDYWINEEVLFREALALGLDRKDAIVRRQLAQKMRFLLSDATLLPEPTDSQLQVWLDQHQEQYGHSGTVSFQHVFLSRGRHGSNLHTEAEKMAAQLKKNPERYSGMGDSFLIGQVVDDATPVRMRNEFGPEFAAAMEKLPDGEWSGPVVSGLGLHFVRITARKPFRPAALTETIERVRTDYRIAARERANQQAFERLRTQYQVEFETVAGEPKKE